VQDEFRIEELLEALQKADISPEHALEVLNDRLTSHLGFARVDAGRGITAVLPEVVLAAGKNNEEICSVVRSLHSRAGLAIVSRVDADQGEHLMKTFPEGSYHPRGRIFSLGQYSGPDDMNEGVVAVVSAGTSDLQAAEEAALILEIMKIEVTRFYDIGVAGIHRLGSVLPELRESRICLVFAGMDAALPTVIGGLLKGPVVAVPTSTGYGTAFRGVTALLSMLNSCSPGICVMNIDNGLGAAAAALRIMRGT
jgi:NCAIR mutase (PurE)-related protein